MRRVAFTMIGYVILASLFGSAAARADDRGADQAGLPIVVDSRGKTVGTFYFVARMSAPDSSVLRKIEDAWYVLPFSSRTGFSSLGVQIFYSAPGCTGTAYIAASPDNLVVEPLSTGTAGIVNGILYYAQPGSIKPRSKLVIKSQRVSNAEGKAMPCTQAGRHPLPEFFGEMKTFELSKLGIPPFTLITKKQQVLPSRPSKK